MTAVNYLWDPVEHNIVRELDDAGTVLAHYTTEPGRFGDLLSQRRNGQDSYYHYDGQGSTLALTNALGDVTDTFTYSAFGEVAVRTGSTVNPFQYIGKSQYHSESESREYEVRLRTFYSPIARWLSGDVLGIGGSNLYQYAQNKPLARLDPSGALSYENVAFIPENYVETDPKRTHHTWTNCGGFYWTIKWKLNPAEIQLSKLQPIYIVQKVTTVASVKTCDKPPKLQTLTHSCTTKQDSSKTYWKAEYFEIWKVVDGVIYYDATTSPPTQKTSDIGFDDMFSESDRPDTRGCFSKYGYAVVIADGTGIEDSVPGKVGEAGVLFAVCELAFAGKSWQAILDKKKGLPAIRVHSSQWDCCKDTKCPEPYLGPIGKEPESPCKLKLNQL
jgi:RHS repeat-associated protein